MAAAVLALVGIGIVGSALWMAPTPSIPPLPSAPAPTASAASPAADLTWAVGRPLFERPSQISAFEIEVRTADGSAPFTETVDLSALNAAGEHIGGALPFISAPANGRVLYGYYDGLRSAMRVVSTRAGTSAAVLETDAIIHRAVLDGSSDSWFALLLDPASRGEVGIVSGEFGGTGMRQLVPPRETVDATDIMTRLFVSLDGTTLVTYDCRDHQCRLRGYDTTLGTSRFDVAAPMADVYGVTRDELLLSGGWGNEPADAAAIAADLGVEPCFEYPCPIVGINLTDGTARAFGLACPRARVIQRGGSSLVIAEATPRCVEDNYRLAVLTLQGNELGAYEYDATEARLVSDDVNQAAGLPPGWILLTGGGVLPPSADSGRLVRISDGYELPLAP